MRSRVLFLWVLVLAASSWRCAGDPSAPRSGGVELLVDWGDYTRGGSADSLHLEIRDQGGKLFLDPLARALADESAIEFDLTVPEAEWLSLELWIDAEDAGGRGIRAAGAARGVRVQAARTTEVEIALENAVPVLGAIAARPGDLDYTVRWTRVDRAVEYELREDSPEGARFFTTDDSLLTLDLAPALRRRGTGTLEYRVRSVLPRGTGLYSAPRAFAIDEVRDLPFVVAIVPSDGAEAVRDTTAPRVIFDREMDWSTLAGATVALTDEESQIPVALEPRGEGATLFLEHPAPLRRGRSYALSVGGPLADGLGRPFDQDRTTEGLQGFASRFTVEVYDPVRVVAIDPEDGSEGITTRPVLLVTLSREVDPATVAAGAVLLEEEDGDAVPRAVAWIPSAKQIRIEPTVPLTYDHPYFVRVTPGILDLRGEPLDQDPSTEIPEYEEFRSEFRTEIQPVGPRVLATIPAAGEENHPTFSPLQVQFDRPIDLASVSQTETFRISKLPIGATIPGLLSPDPERRTFTFAPTGDFEPGIRYRIDLTTGLRDDAGVPLDQDPETPGFQGFTSEFRAERSFRLTAVVPPSNSERVALEPSVRLTFERAVDPTTLEDGIELTGGSQAVVWSRALSPDGRVATLEPETSLETFTLYRVRVDETLRSTEGSRFDQDPTRDGYQIFESHFTTRPDSIPPRVALVVPADGAEGIDPEAEVEIHFTRKVLPASVNAETVVLERAGGARVACAISVSADSTVATLNPTSPLALFREYEVRVLTWVVDPFDVRFDQDPDLPDRQEFRSRFRVDHERVPPQVATVSPGDSLTKVSLLTDVELFFTETMDPATLEPAFRLLDSAGGAVAGSFEVAADSVRALFQPSAPLDEDREYRVVLETTASDRWGNRLDQDLDTPELDRFESVFRTEADRIGPFVLAVAPTDGATGVEPEVTPEILFSEELDGASLALGVALLDSGGLGVPLADLSQIEPGRVRLVPAAPLATASIYTVRVTDAARDTLGNAFDQDPDTPEPDAFTSTFSTRDENVPPVVLRTVFEDTPPPRETRPRIVFSEPIDPLSLDDEDVTLRRTGGAEVPVVAAFLAPDTLEVVPGQLLESQTSYELIVQGLSDLAGNLLDQFPDTPDLDPFVQPFQTARDTVAPRVVASHPEDGDEGLRPDVVVALTFSEPMDTSRFNDLHFQLVRLEGSQEFPADGEITWNEEQTEFFYAPTNPLLLGFHYEVRADYFLQDLAGNPLDQDPETPEEESFIMRFLVGDVPVAVLNDPVCSDSVWVEFDASASHDPDGMIATLVFEWGDGSETVIDDPAPGDFLQGHAYPCLDFKGGDGIDNDGDGFLDGDDCDESYRVVLRVRDGDGLWGADTSGVSFRAFGVVGVEPADGATGVDTLLAAVRLDFSRGVADSSLRAENFHLRYNGFLEVPIDSVHAGESPSQVVLVLGDTLAAGTLHQVGVSEDLRDSGGRGLDQDPCTPAGDPFASDFTTQPAALPRSARSAR